MLGPGLRHGRIGVTLPSPSRRSPTRSAQLTSHQSKRIARSAKRTHLVTPCTVSSAPRTSSVRTAISAHPEAGARPEGRPTAIKLTSGHMAQQTHATKGLPGPSSHISRKLETADSETWRLAAQRRSRRQAHAVGLGVLQGVQAALRHVPYVHAAVLVPAEVQFHSCDILATSCITKSEIRI